MIKILLLLMTVAISSSSIIDGSSSNKCFHTRSRRLLTAFCNKSNLKAIPKNLKSWIQVLDARDNRIGRLFNNSFSRYTNLEELYLSINGIAVIEDSALEPLTKLRILDLTDNNLVILPRTLFHLVSLVKLYVGKNYLTNDQINSTGIVTAPIQLLDFSYNEFIRMPNFAGLYRLLTLNVTGNPITKITTEDLAAFCSLQSLEVSRNQVEYGDKNRCECAQLDKWLKETNIMLNIKLDCRVNNSTCLGNEFSNETLNLYDKCVTALQEHTKTQWIYMTLITTSVVVVVLLIGLGFYLYCSYRRKCTGTFKSRSDRDSSMIEIDTEIQ